MLVYIALVCVSLCVAGLSRAGAAGAWPEAGVGNMPATVDKLVIAFDGWGAMCSIRGNTSGLVCCRAI